MRKMILLKVEGDQIQGEPRESRCGAHFDLLDAVFFKELLLLYSPEVGWHGSRHRAYQGREP
jgi:hypothetical protein